MAWFNKSPADEKLEEKLHASEVEEKEALGRHRKTAINSTLRADDARETIEEMLKAMERRRQDRATRTQ